MRILVYFSVLWLFNAVSISFVGADEFDDSNAVALKSEANTGLTTNILGTVTISKDGSQVTTGNKTVDDANADLLGLLRRGTMNSSQPMDLESRIFEARSSPVPLFSCHSCNSPNCDNQRICHNAIKCFKSRTGGNTQSASVSRDCIREPRLVPILCSSLYSPSQTEDDAINSAYVVQCCEGDLCNGGDFPALPHNIGEQLELFCEQENVSLRTRLG
ncbi:Activin types I and II receptor domain [Trinorchestia longiramus]|nr:Activin types I and II receptor domain [Trinorchestia longiramus]